MSEAVIMAVLAANVKGQETCPSQRTYSSPPLLVISEANVSAHAGENVSRPERDSWALPSLKYLQASPADVKPSNLPIALPHAPLNV